MASPPKGLQSTLDGSSWNTPSRPRTSGLRVNSSTNLRPVNARRGGRRQANTRQPRSAAPDDGYEAEDESYSNEAEEHLDGQHIEEDRELADRHHTSRTKENMGPMKDNGMYTASVLNPRQPVLIHWQSPNGRRKQTQILQPVTNDSRVPTAIAQNP
jgi:hypothetical protein